MRRKRPTTEQLRKILLTPLGEKCVLRVADDDHGTDMQHRIRALLSRVRGNLREQGKKYATFKLLCNQIVLDGNQYLEFVRVSDKEQLQEFRRREDLNDLDALLETTDVKEMLADV